MTAHELGELLLSMPDVPVMMNGWGSDEGQTVEVIGGEIIEYSGKREIHLTHEEVKW